MTTHDNVAQAVSLLIDAVRENPDVVRDALKPIELALADKGIIPERERHLVKMVCAARLVFDDVRGWTCKYCLDCLSQRYRADAAQEYLTVYQEKDVKRYPSDVLSSVWDEAHEAASAIQAEVNALRIETRKKRNDLI